MDSKTVGRYRQRLGDVQRRLREVVETTPADQQSEWQQLWNMSKDLMNRVDKNISVATVTADLTELEERVDWLIDPPKMGDTTTEQSEAAPTPPVVIAARDTSFQQKIMTDIAVIQCSWLDLYNVILAKHPLAANIPVMQEMTKQAEAAKNIMQQVGKLRGLD